MTTPSSAPTPPTAVLQVRDLRVSIGERVVLQSVSLDIAPGSLTVLMGANGSGKSTLGMALAGAPATASTLAAPCSMARNCWSCPPTSALAPGCLSRSSRRLIFPA